MSSCRDEHHGHSHGHGHGHSHGGGECDHDDDPERGFADSLLGYIEIPKVRCLNEAVVSVMAWLHIVQLQKPQTATPILDPLNFCARY